MARVVLCFLIKVQGGVSAKEKELRDKSAIYMHKYSLFFLSSR